MAGAKRVPLATAAASKVGLRPRTALGDIGNNVSEQPQTKLPLKKVTIFLIQRFCKSPPSNCDPGLRNITFSPIHPQEAKPLTAGKVTAKKLPKPLGKALEPEPEPEPVPVLEPAPEPETVKEEKLSPEPILVNLCYYFRVCCLFVYKSHFTLMHGIAFQ